MATLYEFNTTKTLGIMGHAMTSAEITKMVRALLNKKVSKDHADKFVTEFQKQKSSINSAVIKNQQWISSKMVALKLAPVTASPSVLQKAFMVALYGPQKMILQAKFDLSVHLKGANLELQITGCDGAKRTLTTVAP